MGRRPQNSSSRRGKRSGRATRDRIYLFPELSDEQPRTELESSPQEDEPRHKLREWNYRCRDPIRQEAHEALKKEFDAASKRSRADKLMLEGGVFQQQLGDRFLYRFHISAPAARVINADQPCILEVHGRRIDGDIHAVSEDSRSIVLSLAEDHGKALTSIDVIFDLTLLIDLVDRRLVAIDKEPERFTALAGPLFGTLDFPRAEPLALCCEHSNRRGKVNSLTPEQLEAVEKAGVEPFCLVWGPPGTGKTVTVQGVLAELLTAGKRVLFASNTNSAIDNALEDILPQRQCPYSVLAELRGRDEIVRLGRNAQEDVAEQFGPANIAKRQREELEAERNRLAGQRRAMLSKAEELGSHLARLKRAEECLRGLARLQEELHKMPGKEQLQRELEDLRQRRADYKGAMDVLGPVALRALNRIEAAYKGLRKLHGRSSSASLVLARKKDGLVAARKQHERAAAEHAGLRNSLLARVFLRGRIERLARGEQEAARAVEAAENAVASARAALDAVIRREVQCLAELGAAAELLLKHRQVLQAAGAEAANLPLTHQGSAGYEAIAVLLTDDRNLLSAPLGEPLTAVVEQLLPSLTAREDGRTDPVAAWFEKAFGEGRANLQRRERVERRLTALRTKAPLEQQFLNEHAGQKLEWQHGLEIALQEAEVLDGRIKQIQEELEALETDIVGRAQLVAVTMVKASYDELFEGIRFDALVVDEYSMVSLPQLYCVASLVTERIVLCGDHLQLPPIAVSRSTFAKKWLERNFHDWHVKDEDGNPRTEALATLNRFGAELQTQRRMPRQVSGLVRPWYKREGNDLKDAWTPGESDAREKATGHPLLRSRVVILDTTPTNAYSSRSPRGSYHNLIHAGIAAEICRQFIQKGVKPRDIRYMAPYRDQAALTRAVVRQLLPELAEDLEPNVTTIHQSQGRGSPVVIYDLTDGIQKRLARFHKQEKPNLLNVALTRTESRLILLCSYDKMLRQLGQLDHEVPLLEVFNRLKANGAPLIDAKPYADKVFKVIRAADLLASEGIRLSEEQRGSILVLGAHEYYLALAQDLERARESVLILSPFLTPYRVDRLLPLLQALVTRSEGKVSVELITRQPERMFERWKPDPHKGAVARELLDSFADIGVHVAICPDTHGKLVIIDNRVNYWGSTNPGSWRDTQEINTRLEGEGLSRQFIAMARIGPSWPYRPAKAPEGEVDTEKGLREIARGELRQLRWRIGPAHGRPPFAALYSDTIERLVSRPPDSWEAYLAIPELSRRNCVVLEHLEEIEDIIYPIRGHRLPERDGSQGREGPLFS